MGIYSPQALPASDGDPGVVNAEFTADDTGKSSDFTGEMYWGTGDHDFYAYYPYDEGNDSEPRTAVPISLASEQTQSVKNNSRHIGALDFMVATPLTGIYPLGDAGDETSGVNFIYNHIFTLLEFQIIGSGSLKKVKLSGSGALAFSGGTIDITQETPDAGVAYTIDNMGGESGEVTVTLTTPVDLESFRPVSVYMMINPAEYSGNMDIFIQIEKDYKIMTKSLPEGGFERGKKYEVPLDAGDFANTVTFTYRGEEVTYGIVEGANRKLWMDRNLGASRVASAYNDSEAYGDLFQWGRLDDGHQDRGSGTTDELSTTDDPGHDNFITSQDTPYDWRDPQNDDLWQEVEGTIINNGCPAGWRVPTEAEWEAELQSWISENRAGAFASPLKLPVGGYRYRGNGLLDRVGTMGGYWSSTVDFFRSRFLFLDNDIATMGTDDRAHGNSVRCIKD